MEATYRDIRRKAKEEIGKGNYKSAEKVLKEFSAKNPSNLDPIIRLVSLYLKQNKVQEAVTLLESKKDNFKNEPLFYRTFCSVHRTLGNENEALEYIKKAISLDPENPQWKSSLGFIHWLFRDPEKAIEETEKALKFIKEEDFLTILMIKNNLAYYYTEMGGKEDKAREYATFCYENRLKEDIDETLRNNIIDTHGYVKMKFSKDIGEIDKAISLFDEAIKRGAPFRPILSHLQAAYQKRRILSK